MTMRIPENLNNHPYKSVIEQLLKQRENTNSNRALPVQPFYKREDNYAWFAHTYLGTTPEQEKQLAFKILLHTTPLSLPCVEFFYQAAKAWSPEDSEQIKLEKLNSYIKNANSQVTEKRLNSFNQLGGRELRALGQQVKAYKDGDNLFYDKISTNPGVEPRYIKEDVMFAADLMSVTQDIVKLITLLELKGVLPIEISPTDNFWGTKDKGPKKDKNYVPNGRNAAGFILAKIQLLLNNELEKTGHIRVRYVPEGLPLDYSVSIQDAPVVVITAEQIETLKQISTIQLLLSEPSTANYHRAKNTNEIIAFQESLNDELIQQMIIPARRDEYLAELSTTNQPNQNKPNIMPAANPQPVPAAMPNAVPRPALTPDELPTVQLTALMGNVQVGRNQVSVDNAGEWTNSGLVAARGIFKINTPAMPTPANNDMKPEGESFSPSTEPK